MFKRTFSNSQYSSNILQLHLLLPLCVRDRLHLLGILLHNLRHRHLKVLLGHVHSPLTERIHACKGSASQPQYFNVQIPNICAEIKILIFTRSQDWPASVQVPFTSAPELPPICSAIFLKLIPLGKIWDLRFKVNAVARRHQQWNRTWSNSFFWSEFWGCQDGHPHSEVGTQFSWIRSN